MINTSSENVTVANSVPPYTRKKCPLIRGLSAKGQVTVYVNVWYTYDVYI